MESSFGTYLQVTETRFDGTIGLVRSRRTRSSLLHQTERNGITNKNFKGDILKDIGNLSLEEGASAKKKCSRCKSLGIEIQRTRYADFPMSALNTDFSYSAELHQECPV